MNEKPIIFSSEMVRAILEGRKTQTRRVIKPQPQSYIAPKFGFNGGYDLAWKSHGYTLSALAKHAPYGLPGAHLWVRETIKAGPEDIYYAADSMSLQDLTENQYEWLGCYGSEGRESVTIPSIHMPRWASRITLEIVTIGVQRVQDIMANPCDVLAEGLDIQSPTLGLFAFSMLWDRLNKKRGFGWDVNPWVWVIEFRTNNRY